MQRQDIPVAQPVAGSDSSKPLQRKLSGLKTEAQKLSEALELVNSIIINDPIYKSFVPIKTEDKLMSAIEDGILLAEIIDHAIPGTVDSKALLRGSALTPHQKTENLRLAINGAIQIGCASDSLTPHMILQGKSALVTSMLGQLRRVKELQQLTIDGEAMVLSQPGETVEDLRKLPVETLLVRWINFHLHRTGSKLVVKDLGKDLQDGVAYLTLLHQLAPAKCGLAEISEADPNKRMKAVLNCVVNMGISHSFNIERLLEGSYGLHKVLCCMIFNTVNGFKSEGKPMGA